TFVKDKSPEALATVIDKLLQSPRFGERWGRHWLHVAGLAGATGKARNVNYPHGWRYRDYVIKAFNDDKPYDQFIKEQLAGDELWPDSKEAQIATGFLRSYPDEINARDLNLKKQEIAVDLTNTTGTVFLAATVQCANCHNHKFDKISQKEYFQFQAFFSNASARDDVLPLSGRALEDYRQALERYRTATKSIRE